MLVVIYNRYCKLSFKFQNSQISGGFGGFRAYTFNVMSERIARELRNDFYETCINKDVEFFEENKTGEICKTDPLINLNFSVKT